MGRYTLTPPPRVVETRRRLAQELQGVLLDAQQHTGLLPRRRGWLLLLAGAAAGCTLALALKRPTGRRRLDPLESGDPLEPF